MLRRGLWKRDGRTLVRTLLTVAVGLASTFGRAELNSVEEQAIASTYGSGVHSFFAGDYARSYEILSQAIEAGTADPRAWYFRGLAALKLGRLDEAEADFSSGARRESENIGAWGVAKSLERVQGCDRLQLERHRTRARVASLQEDRRRARLRYLDVERAEPEVLRDRVPETVRPVLPDQPFKPLAPAPAPEAAVEELAVPPAPADAPLVDEPAASPAPQDGSETPAADDPFNVSSPAEEDAGTAAP